MLIEWIVIGIPGIVFLVLWRGTGTLSRTGAIVVFSILVAWQVLLFAYWYRRVSRISQELKAIEAFTAER